MKKTLFTLAILVSGFTAKAQDSLEKITIGGFAEAYYAYSFNNPADGNIPLAYNFNRHNEIAVNLALISLKYESERVRANLGIQSGTYPEANYAGEPQIFKHLYDANMGFELSKNFWFDAGIFGASHIGFESAVSKDNWTLTRSLCAENTPYYETGAKLTYETGDFTFTGLVLNGWQNIRDNNRNKALGTQVIWKPSDSLTLNSSSYWGNEKPDSLRQMRFFHNFYLQYQAAKRIGFILGFDLGFQEERDSAAALTGAWNTWYSPVLILKYGISEKTSIAARAEYFSDEQQVIVSVGKPFNTMGYSLGLNYTPFEAVTVRLEGKAYAPKEKIFLKGGQMVNSNTVLSASAAIAF